MVFGQQAEHHAGWLDKSMIPGKQLLSRVCKKQEGQMGRVLWIMKNSGRSVNKSAA